MRKSIKALAVAAFAAGIGAFALAGTAQADPAGSEEMGLNPAEGGGISVLSDWCVGNWNGPVGTAMASGNTDDRDLCNGMSDSSDDLKLGSNICAINWDWNDAVKLGVIDGVKDYKLCTKGH